MEQQGIAGAGRGRQAVAGRRFAVDHLGDQRGVMGGQRPARLAEQVWVRQILFGADFPERLDHVVGVFPHAVVHRAIAARAGPLVIHPQPAADIHPLQADAQPPQIGVVAPHFPQAAPNVVDVGDLRAQVGVQQGQAVRHAALPQAAHGVQHLAGRQAELGFLAAGVLPLAGPDRRQPHPHPQLRRTFSRCASSITRSSSDSFSTTIKTLRPSCRPISARRMYSRSL
jgi:hypothetical protein